MVQQNYLEVFANSTGTVTIRYGIPEDGKIDIEMIAIHPDDLITISTALKDIADEV